VEKLAKIKQLGSGKRSYVVAVAIVVLGILVALGKVHLTPEQSQLIYSLLGGGAIAFLRAGSKNDAAKAATELATKVTQVASVVAPTPADTTKP